jgi:hypothetical protein
MKTLSFYQTKPYFWKNNQLRRLPQELSDEDQKKFFCDFKEVSQENWAKSNALTITYCALL